MVLKPPGASCPRRYYLNKTRSITSSYKKAFQLELFLSLNVYKKGGLKTDLSL